MDDVYHEGNRQLQDKFDSRHLADRIKSVFHDKITDDDKIFIENLDMLFIATVDNQGKVNCSYKGGDAGFIRVLDEQTLAFPAYDGNGMFLSSGNVLQTGQVGLLFINFESQRRMRLNGTATIHDDDSLLAEYPEAKFIIRVHAQEVFPNCKRYVHKMKLLERSSFVPKADCETPVPSWKTTFAEENILPHDDPAYDKSREILDS